MGGPCSAAGPSGELQQQPQQQTLVQQVGFYIFLLEFLVALASLDFKLMGKHLSITCHLYLGIGIGNVIFNFPSCSRESKSLFCSPLSSKD